MAKKCPLPIDSKCLYFSWIIGKMNNNSIQNIIRIVYRTHCVPTTQLLFIHRFRFCTENVHCCQAFIYFIAASHRILFIAEIFYLMVKCSHIKYYSILNSFHSSLFNFQFWFETCEFKTKLYVKQFLHQSDLTVRHNFSDKISL